MPEAPAKVCAKRRFGKVEAMLFLSDAQTKRIRFGPRTKRRESRMYFCETCKSFHVTSKIKLGGNPP